MIILRLKYKKEKNLKFISHLELMKTVERIFRRMELPLTFSQGFNPHVKMSFAAPLPVGVSSESEFLDVELSEKIHLREFLEKQIEFMPNGLSFIEGQYLEKSNSLMSLVSSSEYVINVETESEIDEETMKEKIQTFLGRDEILHTKKNKKGKLKESNIRDRIYSLTYLTEVDGTMVLKTKLNTGSGGNLKPEVLMELFNKYEELNYIDHKLRIHRIDLRASVDNKEVDLMTAR